MSLIEIYTDASVQRKWACWVVNNPKQKYRIGYLKTANTHLAEMTAILRAVQTFSGEGYATLFTDCKHAVTSLTGGHRPKNTPYWEMINRIKGCKHYKRFKFVYTPSKGACVGLRLVDHLSKTFLFEFLKSKRGR